MLHLAPSTSPLQPWQLYPPYPSRRSAAGPLRERSQRERHASTPKGVASAQGKLTLCVPHGLPGAHALTPTAAGGRGGHGTHQRALLSTRRASRHLSTSAGQQTALVFARPEKGRGNGGSPSTLQPHSPRPTLQVVSYPPRPAPPTATGPARP